MEILLRGVRALVSPLGHVKNVLTHAVSFYHDYGIMCLGYDGWGEQHKRGLYPEKSFATTKKLKR